MRIRWSGWLPLLLCVVSPAGEGWAEPWTTAAPLQVARQEVAVAALDGHIYVIGGFAGFSILDSVEVWDRSSDSWSLAESLPTAIHHAAAVALSGKLYVIGGWTDFFGAPTANVWVYDPGTDEWSPRSPLPQARAALGAAALNGRIYAAGGSPSERARDFAVYDVASDDWSPLPNMPTARNHLALAALRGKILAIGGRSDLGAGEGNVAAVEEFDPATGEWRSLAPLRNARSGLAAAPLGAFVLAFGGEGNEANPNGTFPDNDAYDPDRDRWLRLTGLPTPVHGIGATALEGRVHIPGGGPVEGFGTTALHQIYDPGEDPRFPLAIPLLPGPPLALLGAVAVWLLLRRRTRA